MYKILTFPHSTPLFTLKIKDLDLCVGSSKTSNLNLTSDIIAINHHDQNYQSKLFKRYTLPIKPPPNPYKLLKAAPSP